MKKEVVKARKGEIKAKKEEYFENYPLWAVLLSNLVSLSIYATGALLIYQLGIIWMILYLAFIVLLEFRLMMHCRDCYYYGKTCAFGMGRISSIFFKKGDPKRFCKREMTWKNILPDFLVSLIPAVVGIVLLIKDFNWLFLVLVAALFILTSVGNGIVRGQIACKYCKQRELGCPAEKLFGKKKQEIQR